MSASSCLAAGGSHAITFCQCLRSTASGSSGERATSALSHSASCASAAIQRRSNWMGARREHRRRSAYARLRALAQHFGDRFRQARQAHHQLDELRFEVVDARRRELAATLEQPWPVRVGGS